MELGCRSNARERADNRPNEHWQREVAEDVKLQKKWCISIVW